MGVSTHNKSRKYILEKRKAGAKRESLVCNPHERLNSVAPQFQLKKSGSSSVQTRIHCRGFTKRLTLPARTSETPANVGGTVFIISTSSTSRSGNPDPHTFRMNRLIKKKHLSRGRRLRRVLGHKKTGRLPTKMSPPEILPSGPENPRKHPSPNNPLYLVNFCFLFSWVAWITWAWVLRFLGLVVCLDSRLERSTKLDQSRLNSGMIR